MTGKISTFVFPFAHERGFVMPIRTEKLVIGPRWTVKFVGIIIGHRNNNSVIRHVRDEPFETKTFVTKHTFGLSLDFARFLFHFQTQFCVLLLHAVMSLYVKCDFPLWMKWTFICYMISFLVLFSNFYIHAYFAETSGKREPNKANGETVTNGDVLADGMTKPQPVKSKKQE